MKINTFRVRFSVASIALVGSLAGCAARSGSVPARPGAPSASVPVRVVSTDVTAVMPVFVEVTNPAGSVQIEQDPQATVIQVFSLARRAVDPPPGIPSGHWASATFLAREGRAVLEVAGMPEAPRAGGTPRALDLMVRVPKLGGVRVVNAGGSVTVRGASGAVDVANAVLQVGTPNQGPVLGGVVEIRTSASLREGIRVFNGKGGISLLAGGGTAGTINAQAPGGHIAVRTRVPTFGVEATPRTWRGVVQSEGSAIELRTGEGDIDVQIGPGASR